MSFRGNCSTELWCGPQIRSTTTSRTLLVEVDVDNPRRELMPGSYTRVHFALPGDFNAMVIPANTLLFRKEGLELGVVRNGRAELVSVTPGHDYGDSIEILSGLEPNDLVILNPSDSLTSGTPVADPSTRTGSRLAMKCSRTFLAAYFRCCSRAVWSGPST